MKHLKHLFTALLLLCTTVANAHDFEVGGIYYNILSEEDKTVEVTSGADDYTGSVVIPEGITLSKTLTTVLETFDAWTSTNKSNSTTSQTSYTLNVQAGNVLKFDWSVSSESGWDFLVISLDGTQIIKQSGTQSGSYEKTFNTAGSHTLVVKYTKDSSQSRNNDEGEIFNVTLNSTVGVDETVYSVTSIGYRAFSYCDGLTSVVIGNSVTSIGEDAFYGCSSLTSIGNYAFSDCIGLKSAVIGNSVTSIGVGAFFYCTRLTSITSLIPAEDLFTLGYSAFYDVNKTNCTLYVPYGAKETYASTEGWNEFTNIVELEKPITEVTVTINQYGSATYCSPYALDFSEVEGLKAYAATGYKSNSQVVTLTRVQTAEAGVGLFLKGEPGEYMVPVIEGTDEHSLNMLVGTLEATTVNSTDGAMSNYKFTIADGDTEPMFYPFVDGTTLSAGKAYLQIPTAWLPATAQKSLSVRFDDGETTDIDELKGESGEVKTIYDLQGRVVENPTSGIYIINGKKVIIK